MNTLKTIGLAAAISILSLSGVQADGFSLVINQVAKTDGTTMNQYSGRNNTQAMNAAELKNNKTSVRQTAKSDRLNLSQSSGYGNLQAANTVEAYNAEGMIHQKANFDYVTMSQRYGLSNTQALNHVKATY